MRKYDVIINGKALDVHKEPFLNFVECFTNVDENKLDLFRLLIKHLDDRIQVNLNYEESIVDYQAENKRLKEQLEAKNEATKKAIEAQDKKIQECVDIIQELEKEIEYLEEIINFYDNIIKEYVKVVKYYQDKE